MRILAILLIFTIAALAHEGATGIVKERMDGMKAIAVAMKELTAIAKSTQDVSDRISELATVIVNHSGQQMIDRFPEGSVDHPSEATRRIWVDPEPFAKEAHALERAAKSMIADPDSLEKHLLDAAVTCKVCHRDYRMKK